MPDIKEQARALRGDIDVLDTQAKAAWQEFVTLKDSAVKEGVDFTKNADAFTSLDEAGKKYDSIRDDISRKSDDWQRLMALASLDEPRDVKDRRDERDHQRDEKTRTSMGADFVGSEVYKSLVAGGGLNRTDIPLGTTAPVKAAGREETKTLLTTAAGGAALFRNDRIDLNVLIPQAPLNFLDVIPMGSTDSDTIEWVYENTYTNAAAETAEGVAAAESALAYLTATTPVQEITHFIPATKKILADAAQLESLIDQRLTYGVRNRLQAQIVGGNGTTPNLRGILNTVGILTQARGTDSRADAVHKAITKIRVQAEVDYVPQFVGIHPTDWETVTLEKNANGDYYYGGPNVPALGKTLWGLTPVISTAVTVGTPFVFDANQMMCWIREGLSIAMSDSHSTFFIERKVAVLAALRAAFAVTAAKGVCTISSF